jgi:hypothetical protein
MMRTSAVPAMVTLLASSMGWCALEAQDAKRIAPGARIRITLVSAQQFEARYVAGTARFLSYRSEALPGEHVVAWDSVRAVEEWHAGGAVLGGFLGAAAGIGAGLLITRRFKEHVGCEQEFICIDFDPTVPRTALVMMGTMTVGLGIGTALGWVVAKPHWAPVSPMVSPRIKPLPDGRLGLGAEFHW